MIKQGMTLTKEQRGEVKQETKMYGASTSTAAQYSDDKKSTIENDDKKSLQARTPIRLIIILFDVVIVSRLMSLLCPAAKS